jgi:hypothetical protein
MKKVLLFSVLVFCIATSVFVSCNSKQEAKKIGSFELVEQDGKFGLNDSLGTTVLPVAFVEITENSDYDGALFAKDEFGLTTIIAGTTSVISNEAIDSIVSAGVPDYVYIYCTNNRSYLWHVGSTDLFGPFADVKLVDGIVFTNKAVIVSGSASSKYYWGAETINHKELAPCEYEKIIVVKNGDAMAVLVKDLKTWKMFDQDGVSGGKAYKKSSREIERQIKKLNFAGDIGVISVTWKL